jgi:hypothetical protein
MRNEVTNRSEAKLGEAKFREAEPMDCKIQGALATQFREAEARF